MTPHAARRRSACMLAILLLAGSPAWGQEADAPPAGEAQEGAAPTGDAPAASPQPPASEREVEQAADQVEQALQRLRQAGTSAEDVLALTLAAMELVRAERWDALDELLAGGAVDARVAVLSALRNAQSPELLARVLELAASADDERVRSAAGEHLDGLALVSRPVFDALLAHLAAQDLPGAQLERAVRALGRSRRLAAVDALVEQLTGPFEAAASAALARLTGRAPDAPARSPAEWAEWWEKNRWQTREQLLEQALERARDDARAALRARDERIVQLELRHMGQDVGRLIEALELDLPAVRLEAARRLGRHPNTEQAASAVPVLLERLGHPANGAATQNGNGHAAPASQAGAEQDPEVRRALVAALGVLGRDRPEVRAALLHELRHDDLGTAAEAVRALARVRDAPGLVLPLLDLLERHGLDETLQVTALTVIAQNRPLGVTPRLLPWTAAERPAAVRAAGVRALLAGADPSAVLDQVQSLVASEGSADVRYAVAMGLGEQLRRLARDDSEQTQAVRTGIVQVLGGLLDDVDPSVRAEAASSLGDSAQPGALGLLETRSRAEADASVMLRVIDALGALGVIDAVDTIGRVCSNWQGEGAADLESAARRALQRIGSGKPAPDWLGMARTLQQVGAFPLAAFVLREMLQRFEADPAVRDTVAQARGELANVLWLSGRAEEAHALLVELHEADAPHPPASTRLDLLARTSEQLGFHDQAADYYAERLGILGEGDSTRDENRRSLLRTLLLAGRFEEALPRAEALLAEDGADNALLEDLARAQAGAGLLTEARATYQRLLERLPAEDAAARERVRGALEALAPAAPPQEPADAGAGGDAPAEG